MRLRFFAVIAVLVASAGVISSAVPVSAAGATCFGRAATVVPDGNTFYLTAGDDVVVGTNGADYVTTLDPGAEGGTDYICTRGGDDEVYMFGSVHATVDAGSGADTVRAFGTGSIELDLGPGNDSTNTNGLVGTVRGGTGNDTIFFQGFDILPGSIVYADSGNDYIQSASADFIYSGSGKDTVIDQSSTGSTLVDCGSGRDIFYAPNAVTIKSCERPY